MVKITDYDYEHDAVEFLYQSEKTSITFTVTRKSLKQILTTMAKDSSYVLRDEYMPALREIKKLGGMSWVEEQVNQKTFSTLDRP